LRAIFRFSGLFLLLLWSALPVRAAGEPEHVPGRLLAGYRGDRDAPALRRTLLLHRAAIRRHVPQLGLEVLNVPEAAGETIRASLLRTGLFDYVEPDYYAHTASTDPDDPSYLAQWHLPKIGSPRAWAIGTGSPAVTVAVVDSGIYAQHPDLEGKLVPGWNFVHSNSDTSDVLGHGTAVAGTLAAATNNGIGIAGVNWGSRIMPLVVVDASDFAAYSDIAAAIQYAADRGVRIINVSIGGASSSESLQRAVDYAWSKGSVVFAAAMNNSTDARYYPAACASAVAVSATDSNDHLASFSNFGSWITLAAPGTNILSTMNGGGYGYWSGTSFSSPIVAGVAALIVSVSPQLSNAALVSLLQQTADNVGDRTYFGAGRINAWRAMLAVQPQPRKRTSPPFAPPHHGTIH
jgi:thermitase